MPIRIEEIALVSLRKKIESQVGRPIRSPKDFSYLSEEIFAKLHVQISATTLKRIWGYIEESSTPRNSTLDVLSQFVGYESWEVFRSEAELLEQNKGGVEQKSFISRRTLAVSFLILLFIGVFGYYGYTRINPLNETDPIIKVGEKFSSPKEYLKLFGINAKDSLWGQVVPHHPMISIWGPQYHHPNWHNDGDKKKMMPTITEYWTSSNVDPEDIVQRNFDQFKHYTRLNEIRITFMKDLVDSNYVYLGVYRLSLEKSDTAKCVWEKVADDCNLNKLDYLESLRN